MSYFYSDAVPVAMLQPLLPELQEVARLNGPAFGI
jgi:hypothetical protein